MGRIRTRRPAETGVDGSVTTTPASGLLPRRASHLGLRFLLAIACGLAPLAVDADTLALGFASLSVVLLAQDRFSTATIVGGGGSLVAELAVALRHGHSDLALVVAVIDGLLVLALSGLTHPTGHRENVVADVVDSLPVIGIVCVGVAIVPSFGGAGLFAGCLAAGILIALTGRPRRLRRTSEDRHRPTGDRRR